jgi:hypothetical protein
MQQGHELCTRPVRYYKHSSGGIWGFGFTSQVVAQNENILISKVGTVTVNIETCKVSKLCRVGGGEEHWAKRISALSICS